ncbi:unnamed protein product, partial [Phaeothamnion confervicola]
GGFKKYLFPPKILFLLYKMAGGEEPPHPLTILRGHDSPVMATRFLSAELLLSGGQDGVATVWQLSRRRPRQSWDAHSGNPILHFEKLDAGVLVSQGKEGIIKLWDIERIGNLASATPEPLAVLATGAYHFCRIAAVRWPRSGEIAEASASQLTAVSSNESYAAASSSDAAAVQDATTAGEGMPSSSDPQAFASAAGVNVSKGDDDGGGEGPNDRRGDRSVNDDTGLGSQYSGSSSGVDGCDGGDGGGGGCGGSSSGANGGDSGDGGNGGSGGGGGGGGGCDDGGSASS